MIGKTVSHYRIISKLGEGGMGVVYKAQDTRLDRLIALKFLPASLGTQDTAKKRFIKEAKASSSLEHPNICAVFDIGETDDGQMFIAMPHYDGETLQERIARGAVEVGEAIGIVTQLASGLAKAHEQGIVHRDIKPGNIFITKDGHVKILDFGLAKLATDTRLTKSGTTLGTIAYMSPEQASGGDVDARSDIFSLGSVFYELLTGQPPFRADHAAAVIYGILHSEPDPVGARRSDIPDELEKIVRQALAKNADERFQSAQQLKDSLARLGGDPRVERMQGHGSKKTKPSAARRSKLLFWLAAVAVVVVGGILIVGRSDQVTKRDVSELPPTTSTRPVTSVPAPRSIAVMAFVNMSSDPEQEYFANGIAEELLNLLGANPDLKVISRSSAFSYKGKNIPLKQIAQELAVAHILEGSVRKVDNQVRVTAQLIDTRSDTQQWSETYDRTLDDIFAVQTEIASDVAIQLKVTLEGMLQVRETDPQAYALYLQAQYFAHQNSHESSEKAIELLKQVLSIDAEYFPAWGELSAVYLNQAGSPVRPADEGYRLAREAATRALAIDPNFAPALANLGWVVMAHDGDMAVAAGFFERALELAPRDITTINAAVKFLEFLGRPHDSIQLAEYLVSRDPINPSLHANLGSILWRMRRWDDAIASFRMALTLSPDRIGVRKDLAGVLLCKGEPEAALAVAQDDPAEGYRLISLAMIYHDLGRGADSDTELGLLIGKYEKEGAYNIAYVFAYRGEADSAFNWLDKAVEYNDPGLVEIPAENLFANINDDPRWLPFLESIGKSPAQLAAIEFNVTLPE